MDKKVWGFFYGSYLNFDVLAEVDLRPDTWTRAKLDGYRITFNPRANLTTNSGSSVYGINAKLSHQELSCLYAHAKDILGQEYLPEAVLTQTLDGDWTPALCYISPNDQQVLPERDYVNRILQPCEEYEFPESYLQELRRHLESATS